MLPASAVPVKVGVVSPVTLSEFDATPLSVPEVMVGMLGAAGAAVSMVMGKPVETTETLPAASVAWAVMVWDALLRQSTGGDAPVAASGGAAATG